MLLLHCLPPHTCQSLVPSQLTRGAIAATRGNHPQVHYLYYHCCTEDVFLIQLVFLCSKLHFLICITSVIVLGIGRLLP